MKRYLFLIAAMVFLTTSNVMAAETNVNADLPVKFKLENLASITKTQNFDFGTILIDEGLLESGDSAWNVLDRVSGGESFIGANARYQTGGFFNTYFVSNKLFLFTCSFKIVGNILQFTRMGISQ